MALIKCPECGKEISDACPSCPGCGYPITEEMKNNPVSVSKKNNKKRNIKLIVGICMGIILTGVLIAVIFVYNSPSSKYSRANNAFEAGDYEKAIKIYSGLGSYLDSSDRLLLATQNYNYAEGNAALNNGDYDGAIQFFEQCMEFEDASILIQNAHYQKGLKQAENGEYNSAMESFRNAGDYEDSGEQIKRCFYEIGIDYVSSNEIESAAECFKNAEGYNDAEEQIISLGDTYTNNGEYESAIRMYSYSAHPTSSKYYYYAKGMISRDKLDYDAAKDAFKSAGDVLDAKERYEESLYRWAKEEFNSKAYDQARSDFSSLGAYEDSMMMVTACDLMTAKSEMNNGNLNAASKILSNIPDDYEYNGVKAADYKKILQDNAGWVTLCGRWVNKSLYFETNQVYDRTGSKDRWSVTIDDSTIAYVEIRLKIADNGFKTLSLVGTVLVPDNYSSIKDYLDYEEHKFSYYERVDSTGTVTADSYTKVVLGSTVKINYHKVNNTSMHFTENYISNATLSLQSSY